MSRIIKLFFIALFSYSILFAYDINDKVIYQKDFENKTVYLPLNNYRTLNFSERIKNIELTNSENIRAEFIDNNNKPLMGLKILGKNIGSESALITLESGKSIQINFSIMQNLDSIITIVKVTYPNLIIEQANDTIILKGYVKDYKEKNLVIDIFKKAGIKADEKLVDMIETSNPTKMIRVKLYAVEINKDEGLTLKNNWMVSSKNYMSTVDEDGLYYNQPLNAQGAGLVASKYGVTVDPTTGAATPIVTQYSQTSADAYNIANNQRNKNLEDTLDGVMTNAVSLTGGLTGVANYLGKYFNVGLTLQYLANEGVANILDETTLITLENKEATFHAGGTIRIKSQTTTAEGVPSTDVEKIRYGLQLKIEAKNVMKDNYIDLKITTSNTKIDWSNTVDDIPSFLENEVITHVMAKNGATIVLGGLINNQNSFDEDKIPLLGDIPVLGFLFRSKAFVEGKSELVFFLTPEVVDPSINNQSKIFTKTRKKMLDTSSYRDENNILEKSLSKEREEKNAKKLKKENSSDNTSFNLFKSNEKQKLTNEEKHQLRVNEILGY